MFRDPIRLHPFREPSSQPLSSSSPPAHSGITVLRAYPRGTRVYAPAKKAVNRFHCLRIEMSCPPLSRLRPDATGLAITRISVPFAFREFSLVFFPPILFFFFFIFFYFFHFFFVYLGIGASSAGMERGICHARQIDSPLRWGTMYPLKFCILISAPDDS